MAAAPQDEVTPRGDPRSMARHGRRSRARSQRGLRLHGADEGLLHRRRRHGRSRRRRGRVGDGGRDRPQDARGVARRDRRVQAGADRSPAAAALVQLLQNAVLSAHQAVFQRGQAEPDKAGHGHHARRRADRRRRGVRRARRRQPHLPDPRRPVVADHDRSHGRRGPRHRGQADDRGGAGLAAAHDPRQRDRRLGRRRRRDGARHAEARRPHAALLRRPARLLPDRGRDRAAAVRGHARATALKEMVELAKTRGGHDNITGVAVQVIDISEAVPAQLDGEPTQPVDVEPNPFAADEPTETAFITPPGLPPRVTPSGAPVTVSPLKTTQPMRVIHDDKLPPDELRKELGERPTDPRMAVATPADGAEAAAAGAVAAKDGDAKEGKDAKSKKRKKGADADAAKAKAAPAKDGDGEAGKAAADGEPAKGPRRRRRARRRPGPRPTGLRRRSRSRTPAGSRPRRTRARAELDGPRGARGGGAGGGAGRARRRAARDRGAGPRDRRSIAALHERSRAPRDAGRPSRGSRGARGVLHGGRCDEDRDPARRAGEPRRPPRAAPAARRRSRGRAAAR